MIRASTEWYSSGRDDTNPFFEDEIHPREYTSNCARAMFRAFRYVCLFVLYVILLFSVLFVVISLYGFAHFSSFRDGLSKCFGQNQETTDKFRQHHAYRLAFQMTYGLSATAFALTATRLSKFNPFAKVCLTVVGLVICLVCLAGNVQEIIWPLSLSMSKSCTYDFYVIWLYRSWPWYTCTLISFALFIGVKWLEKARFIKKEES